MADRVDNAQISNAQRDKGSLQMVITGVAFIAYGMVFLLWNFHGGGFELFGSRPVATRGGGT